MFKKTAFVILAGTFLGLVGCQQNTSTTSAGNTETSQGDLIGSQYNQNSQQQLSPLVQAIADGMIGHDVGSDLDDKDQTSLALRTRETLDSAKDGQTMLWKSDHTHAHGSLTVVSTESQSLTAELKHNAQVLAAKKVNLLDKPYKTLKGTNIRIGPSTEYSRISSMNPGISFTALAETPSHWILVGRHGVGIGYIYGRLASPVASNGSTDIDKLNVTKGDPLQNAFDLESMKLKTDKVSVSSPCRTVKFQLSDDKEQDADQVKMCKDAAGTWEVI